MSELRTEPITRTQIVRFAGAGGDFNPLHHDEEFAHAAGLPSVIAHGQLTAALLSRVVLERFGLDGIASYSVRLTAMVFPGDVLILRATDGEDGALVLEAVRESDGKTVATGSALQRER